MSTFLTGPGGVEKNYGVRNTGGANGQYSPAGAVKSLTFKVDAQFLADAEDGNLNLNTYIPLGASVIEAYVVTHTVFGATDAITLTTSTQGTFPVAAAGALASLGKTDITTTGNLAVDDYVDTTEDITVDSAVASGTEGYAEMFIKYVHTVL